MQKSFREVMVLNGDLQRRRATHAIAKKGTKLTQPQSWVSSKKLQSHDPITVQEINIVRHDPITVKEINIACLCMSRIFFFFLFIVHRFPIKVATFLLHKLTPLNQNGLLNINQKNLIFIYLYLYIKKKKKKPEVYNS